MSCVSPKLTSVLPSLPPRASSPRFASTSVLHLPTEILGLITNFNRTSDANNFFSTCRTLQTYSKKNRELHFAFQTIDDETLITILKAHRSKIDSITISNCANITEKSIEFLVTKCPKLISLNLSGLDLNNNILKSLSQLSYLKTLKLNYSDWLTGAGLINLQELKGLEQLHLANCLSLKDHDLRPLFHHHHLKVLDLSRNIHLTGEGIRHLSGLQRLTTLKLAEIVLKDAHLVDFSLNPIESLDVSGCDRIQGYFLKHFDRISDLNLANCEKFKGENLAHLKNVRWLDLANCKDIQDQDLLLLKNSNKLSYLNLTGCDKITDRGLEVLPNLKHLIKLDLTWCDHITDQSLVHISSLKELTWLYLTCCDQITDKGLRSLLLLDLLCYLDLMHCDKTTAQAISELCGPIHEHRLKIMDHNGGLTRKPSTKRLEQVPGV
jgi:F-box and leucine-rich repeat protein 14